MRVGGGLLVERQRETAVGVGVDVVLTGGAGAEADAGEPRIDVVHGRARGLEASGRSG